MPDDHGVDDLVELHDVADNCDCRCDLPHVLDDRAVRNCLNVLTFVDFLVNLVVLEKRLFRL